MHTLLCVCLPRVESLFPPVLLKSCNQIPLAFKVWFSRNSSSRCWTPRSTGSLTWGSEPSFQWVDFCSISVLQFVSHPLSSYGIWFYCDAPLLLSHCSFSFVFGCGVSCLVSSSVFLSMTVQQLVVILVFLQEGVSAHPSTPPSWTNLLCICYFCLEPSVIQELIGFCQSLILVLINFYDQCLIGEVENLLYLAISKTFTCNAIYSTWIIYLKNKWKLKHKRERIENKIITWEWRNKKDSVCRNGLIPTEIQLTGTIQLTICFLDVFFRITQGWLQTEIRTLQIQGVST